MEGATMNPIDSVLSRLGDAKRSGKGWKARCPAHEDRHSSLSVTEGNDGRVLLHCFAGCVYESIVNALGVTPQELGNPPRGAEPKPGPSSAQGRRRGITLAQLAYDKHLSIEFLQGLGLHDLPDGGVAIPYYDTAGQTKVTKRRTAVTAKNGSFWPANTPLMPYGREDLEAARTAGYLIIPEGESDRWTLKLHGYPALSLPGAQATKCLAAEDIHGISKIFVIKEPDTGGDAFVWHGAAATRAGVDWRSVSRVAQRLERCQRAAPAAP